MKVKCNYCEEIFEEEELYTDRAGVETCPHCEVSGCITDWPTTIEEFEELLGHEIKAPYGYALEVDDVEPHVIAVCKGCGAWIGTYLGGESWTFSSAIDFGDLEKGLCDTCTQEAKRNKRRK